jgi:rRNA processing protein Krr1/Pno1
MRDEPDFGAIALALRDLRVHVAQAFLAVRRDDDHAAQAHLIAAQQIVAAIDRGLPLERHG